MSLPRTVADVLPQHVVVQLEEKKPGFSQKPGF